jgi:hypothetical protein
MKLALLRASLHHHGSDRPERNFASCGSTPPGPAVPSPPTTWTARQRREGSYETNLIPLLVPWSWSRLRNLRADSRSGSSCSAT